MKRLTTVRIAVQCFLALLPCFAVEAHDAKPSLLKNIAALREAKSDAEQDSINKLLKVDLREFLGEANALLSPMDDVPLSRVDAPDGTFRLITWNLPRTDGSHVYEGFLLVKQGRTTVLHELHDATPSLSSPEAVELGTDKWYGALYYHVQPVTKGGRTYYTLLGWKGFNNVETRKVIDVLSFRGGKPRFGAELFGEGKVRAKRKVYAFSAQATMVLRWEPEMEAILLDHLSPRRADMEGKAAYYGPDMTHDAYFWYKGHWWLEPDIDARDKRLTGKNYKPPPKELEPKP